MSDSVPCPCVHCGGKLVSRYKRRQHTQKYGDSTYTFPKRTDRDDHDDAQVDGQMPQLQAGPSDVHCDDHDQLVDSVEGPSNLHSEVVPHSESYEYDECDTSVQCHGGSTDNEEIQALNDPDTTQDHSKDLYEWPTGALQCEDPIVHEPLYDGAGVTVLQTLAKHFEWFTSHPGTSKEALSDMLQMQHDILPEGHRLPFSYRSARALIEPFLVKPIIFHVCSNDCIIYRNEYADATECPECQSPRYKRAKLPVRKFVYLPIGPRLVRLFGTENLAQLVQSHPGATRSADHCDMYDIHDSPAWKSAYSSDGIFGGDKRGIAFGICADGVNPFSHLHVTYSMCPIVMSLLNFPRDVRYSFENIFLLGIIPGNGTHEAKKFHPYMEVVIDEMLQLSSVQMYDAYQGAPFQLKVDILLYILDYPGIGKMFNISGSGAYKACLWCDIRGTYNSDLKKMVYLENRRYLPHESLLRKRKRGFPTCDTELRAPPPKRNVSMLKKYHKAVDEAAERRDAQLITKSTGCKGTYSCTKLPTHNPVAQTTPDAMHTVKDAIVNVFDLITGRDDTMNCRQCELNLGGHFGITQSSLKQKIQRKCPGVPYSLSTSDIALADKRALNILTPIHVGFVPGPFFSKCSGLKSHDWKQIVSQGIMKYCLKGLLGNKQRNAIFQYIDVCCKILAEKQSLSDVPQLLEEMNSALAVLERDMPITLQVITLHLMRHVVEGIEKFGPVYATWMYSFERFNSWMCQRALNRAHPEVTIMETYRVYEWSCFVNSKIGMCQTDDVIQTPATDGHQELKPNEMEHLSSYYLKKLPQYAALINEYTKEKQRSITSRRKSKFPSKDKWKPPARELSSDEQELLLGPSKSISMLKRVQMRASRTRRWITYSTGQYEQSSRVSSSYVSLNRVRDETPQFGRIIRIFTHTFAKCATIFLEVSLFNAPTFDNDTSMWSVPLPLGPTTCITSILDISQPLVVAREDDNNTLWFLNYN